MEDNSLLMIVLAFVVGYMCSGMIKNMCGYNLVEGARRGGSTHPHQIHFEILSETGLVGYILLFGMLIYFMVKGLNSFVKSKNILNLSAFIFVLATLLPLIPSGSFFTSYTATLFWINFSFLLKKNF